MSWPTRLTIPANQIVTVAPFHQSLLHPPPIPPPHPRCSLTHLTLRSCALRDAGLAALCRGARFNRHLTHLALIDPGTGPNSLQPLIELLEQNVNITHIAITRMSIYP